MSCLNFLFHFICLNFFTFNVTMKMMWTAEIQNFK